MILGGVFAVAALGVFGLWASHHQRLHSGGEWLTAVGRVTGLEGTLAALVAVVLLSRIPWLDRSLGMDRLFAWHRWVGQVTVWLLVAHALFVIWGYGATFHQTLTSETDQVVLKLPDMLAATFALGLLVGIAVVSIRRLRRRLKYQTWYFVHLYVYLALALSFSHQLATGADFIGHPVDRYVWVGLYSAALALLLRYRAAQPLYRAFRHRLRVSAIEPAAAGSTSIYITGRRLEDLRAEPGQFGLWRFMTRSGWWQAHPFSLSAPPDGQRLRLTVRSSGDFTSDVARHVRVGTRVVAEGPFGSFTARQLSRSKVLLVAGGAGIAPVRALLEAIPAEPGQLVLLYRAADAAQMSLRDELEAVAARRQARAHYLLGPRQERAELFDSAWLRQTVGTDLADYEAFICGPHGFMEQVGAALREAGVPARHIHMERFEM